MVELLVPMAIRDYNWLGSDVNVIYTSEYDDLRHGIDSGVQFLDPGRTNNLGMEIDFTISERDMAVKIKKIAEGIAQGRLSKIKYFDSPSTGKQLNVLMPKVAFGVPMPEMIDFADTFLEAKKRPNNRPAQDAMRNHTVRRKFLSYVGNQLREFGRISAEAGNAAHATIHSTVLESMRRRSLVK
jgi:hypothetical protein